MITNQTPRPPIHLHSTKCFANALINAIENARDEEGITDLEFALKSQANDFHTTAHTYLNEGMLTCTCPDCFGSCCR